MADDERVRDRTPYWSFEECQWVLGPSVPPSQAAVAVPEQRPVPQDERERALS